MEELNPGATAPIMRIQTTCVSSDSDSWIQGDREPSAAWKRSVTRFVSTVGPASEMTT